MRPAPLPHLSALALALAMALTALAAAPAYACDAPVPIYEGGRRTGRICPEGAAGRGLTIVDLSDDWTPFVLSRDPATGAEESRGAPPYRATFLALADERLDDVPPEFFPERYLELFGIPPTFRVLRERLGDDARHACHGQVDDAALLASRRVLRPRGEDLEGQRRDARELAMLDRRLARLVERRGVAAAADLEGDPRAARLLARRARIAPKVQTISALQEHLVCDGLLEGRYERGVFNAPTAEATEVFHHRRMVLSGRLFTAGTRQTLSIDSREADFAALLRTLRERVASATGLIEDGSAGRSWGTVLGRTIDPELLHADAGQPAAPNPAPDLLSPATEAAARALGWLDPRAAIRSLTSIRLGPVALRLPALPGYHRRPMELRAEIDRGDVRFDSPLTADGRRRAMGVAHRAVITLFARDGEGWTALVRWPTTIGGWNDELGEGGTSELRYKESPAGRRVWRQVVAGPAWVPPRATPDDELVRRVRGGIEPRYDTLGPGYRSAFGLAMLVHERLANPRAEVPVFTDEGIRTHGSVAYRSILRGTSHGCHRLHNHLAVRLASFVLTHREHVRVGALPLSYRRELRVGTDTATVEMSSRGYGFELTDPVPVNVLRGRIVGRRRTPFPGSPFEDTDPDPGADEGAAP